MHKNITPLIQIIFVYGKPARETLRKANGEDCSLAKQEELNFLWCYSFLLPRLYANYL